MQLNDGIHNETIDIVLAILRVVLAEGLWTAADFPQELGAKATEWAQAIADYRADAG